MLKAKIQVGFFVLSILSNSPFHINYTDDAADKEKIRINMNSNGDNIVSFNVLDLATAPAGLPLLGKVIKVS